MTGRVLSVNPPKIHVGLKEIFTSLKIRVRFIQLMSPNGYTITRLARTERRIIKQIL